MAKNKGGRPPRFKSASEIQVLVDEYFKKCEGTFLEDEDGNYVLNNKGYPIKIDFKRPGIVGLALYLGFNSRQSLLNYQAKPEFLDVITRARSRCEEYIESCELFSRDGARGAEFWLRAVAKWDDRPPDDETEKEKRKQELREIFGEVMNADKFDSTKTFSQQTTEADNS